MADQEMPKVHRITFTDRNGSPVTLVGQAAFDRQTKAVARIRRIVGELKKVLELDEKKFITLREGTARLEVKMRVSRDEGKRELALELQNLNLNCKVKLNTEQLCETMGRLLHVCYENGVNVKWAEIANENPGPRRIIKLLIDAIEWELFKWESFGNHINLDHSIFECCGAWAAQV